MKAFAFLLLLLACLAGCDDTPGEWSAFVYPDAHDRSNWQRTDRFKTEGACKEGALYAISQLPEPKKAAWECKRTGAPTP